MRNSCTKLERRGFIGRKVRLPILLKILVNEHEKVCARGGQGAVISRRGVSDPPCPGKISSLSELARRVNLGATPDKRARF